MLDSVRGLHVVLLIGLAWVVQTAQVCPDSQPQCTCDGQTVTCFDLQEVPKFTVGDNNSIVNNIVFVNGNITVLKKTSLPPGLDTVQFQGHPLTHISSDAFDRLRRSLHTITIYEAKFKKLPRALRELRELNNFLVINTPMQKWESYTVTWLSQRVYYLVLKNVNLTSWPSWISKFWKLYHLDLSHNSLNAIPDNAFDSISNNLLTLILTKTNLVGVPQAITKLSKLTELNLGENKFTNTSDMQSIIRSPFSQTLKYIYLNSVGLTEFPNLSKFGELKTADFSHNKLTFVNAMIIPTNLTKLLLAYNKLTFVHPTFVNLSSVFHLDMRSNKINTIKPNSLPPRLIYLDLSHNKLEQLTETSFRDRVFLEELKLHHNSITRVSKNVFSGLLSLKELTIDKPEMIKALEKLYRQVKVTQYD